MRFVQLAAGMPLARIAREDLTLGTVDIKAGEAVLPLLSAADRDPRVFAHPDRLDLTRNPPHLAFGAGMYRCLGAYLAMMELQEALRGLLSQVPGLRLAVPPEQVRYKPDMVVNSPFEVPVTWD
ncbi:MAG TPA: cytochrome P450 [Streptosporangiaceae bacterium]